MEQKEFAFNFRVYNVNTDETYDRKEFTIALSEEQIREVAHVMDENGGYPVPFSIVQNVEKYVSEELAFFYQSYFAPDDDDFWDNYLFEVDDEIPEALLKEAEKYVTHKDADITYYYMKDGKECSGSVLCSLKPNTFWTMVECAKKNHEGNTDFVKLASQSPVTYDVVMRLVHAGIAGRDVNPKDIYLNEFPYKVLEMAVISDETVKTEDRANIDDTQQSEEPEIVELYESDVIERWKFAAELLRIATASDWKTKPMPKDNHYVILTDIPLTPVAMDRLRAGHLPRQMEDRWFMYCEGDTIRYFRSWTGENIFNAYCEKANDDCYHIKRIEVNTMAYTNNSRHAKEALENLLQLLANHCDISIEEQVSVIRSGGTANNEMPQDTIDEGKGMKDRFYEWLFNNKKEATARVYWSMLEHTLRRIIRKDIDEDADSIFSYTTKEELQECIDKLMVMPTFVEANEQKHRAITAAISQYKKFIEQL